MRCPECNGRGESIYYEEVDRDENTVTVEQRKGICRTCNGSGEKPMTNADRIRAMTDEEMTEFLETVSIAGCPCPARSCRASCRDCIMDWLQQPAEVDNEV